MGMAILTDLGKLALFENEISWAGMKMILFSAPGVVDEETEYADLTLGAYSGYAEQNVALGAPAIDDDHRAVREMTTLRFQHDGGGSDDTIEGWGIYQIIDAVEVLIAVKLFDEGPKTFAAGGDFVDIPLEWRIFQPEP